MSQYFDEDGKVTPVTVIEAGPITITQLKNKEKDGYVAVQVGYDDQKESRLTKAKIGHLKGTGSFKTLREFLVDEEMLGNMKTGDKIELSVFSKGDKVEVSGISKGKGFQGVIKRHGFHGGPRSHGQKHSEHEAGSIGGGLRNRVPKGMRMGGRMGSDTVTVKNLKVIDIDLENNLILIKGAIPGRRGTLVKILG